MYCIIRQRASLKSAPLSCIHADVFYRERRQRTADALRMTVEPTAAPTADLARQLVPPYAATAFPSLHTPKTCMRAAFAALVSPRERISRLKQAGLLVSDPHQAAAVEAVDALHAALCDGNSTAVAGLYLWGGAYVYVHIVKIIMIIQQIRKN